MLGTNHVNYLSQQNAEHLWPPPHQSTPTDRTCSLSHFFSDLGSATPGNIWNGHWERAPATTAGRRPHTARATTVLCGLRRRKSRAAVSRSSIYAASGLPSCHGEPALTALTGCVTGSNLIVRPLNFMDSRKGAHSAYMKT